MSRARLIPATASRKMRRTVAAGAAERSLRRGPAGANSLGRVVPAVWTTAGLASAASPGGKPARAGCAPFASAGRCGAPGFLNVSRAARPAAQRTLKTCIQCCIHADRPGRCPGCTESLAPHASSVAIRSQVSGARRCRHLRQQPRTKRSAWPGWEEAQPRLSLCWRHSDA